MRDGSVIIDMAAANGGNCPLTEPHKVLVKHGVTVVGHTNYPSLMAGDASAFYANNVFNLVQLMVEEADTGLQFKDFAEDEITKGALIEPEQDK